MKRGMMHMGLAACLSTLAACQLVGGIEDTELFDVDAAAPPQEYVVRGVAGGVQDPVALEFRFPGGIELLSITADGPFAFEAKIEEGASYTVVFVGNPPCLLDGATGVLTDADVEIVLACNGAATLVDIGLSGPAAPELGFMPGQLAYTADVSLLQQSMSITPIASKADATITVAGQPVVSGTASAPLPLDLGDNQVEVVVSHASGLQRTYRVTVRRAAALAQYAYGKASNTDGTNQFPDEGDQFGWSVALSGDTLAVGARYEDSAATGVDGNQADNSAPNSGAVYLFHRSGTAWTQEAYLKASNTGTGDQFGYSVALSGDTLAVGAVLEDSAATGVDGNQADNSAAYGGAVYVFRRVGSAWAQEAYLKASNTGENDWFSFSLALSGDTLAVGARFEGSAATGVDGNQSNDSAPNSGAVYLFRRAGAIWAQEAYLKASNTGAGDQFGYSVALSGDTLAVGAVLEDSAATGVDDNQDSNSVTDSGAVYVFRRAGAAWAQEAYLKASNTGTGDQFGYSVALSGDTLAVGARFEGSAATGVGGNQDDDSAIRRGAVYVFRRAGAAWAQEAYLKASNTGTGDRFGTSVALSGDTLAVGAVLEGSAATGVDGNQDDDSAGSSGAVYVFRRAGAIWAQEAYLKASNTGAGDNFGHSMALSGDTLAVGAVLEDSAATGVDGNQDDNSTLSSGAVYIFH